MPIELYALLIMTLFFLMAWLPASAAKRRAYGRAYLLSNRDQTDLPPLPPWGDRANRAYENLKSYFPAFVVLVLGREGRSDGAIGIAAGLYVAGRIAHFVLYTAGAVSGRALGWFVALVANLYLLVRCF
jgi:uncharacterized MAPEG superfamily protein